MSRRRRNPLSPEDRALWRAVTREAVPLHPEARGLPAPEEQPRTPEPETPPAAPDAPARRRPRAGADLAPPETGAPPPAFTVEAAPPALEPLGPSAPGLDRRTARRLGRGARAPGARIDLHGMTAARAHRALDACIARALAQGLRLVLVITGKGGRPVAGPDAPFMRPAAGLLRREAPRWLRAGPYAARIVGIYPAHPRHGGAGAFYVYLKKPR